MCKTINAAQFCRSSQITSKVLLRVQNIYNTRENHNDQTCTNYISKVKQHRPHYLFDDSWRSPTQNMARISSTAYSLDLDKLEKGDKWLVTNYHTTVRNFSFNYHYFFPDERIRNCPLYSGYQVHLYKIEIHNIEMDWPYLAMPITPQAERAPALPEQIKDMKIFNFQIQIINIEKNKHKNHPKNIVRREFPRKAHCTAPVVLLSSWPPWPRSSWSAWITTVRPAQAHKGWIQPVNLIPIIPVLILLNSKKDLPVLLLLMLLRQWFNFSVKNNTIFLKFICFIFDLALTIPHPYLFLRIKLIVIKNLHWFRKLFKFY